MSSAANNATAQSLIAPATPKEIPAIITRRRDATLPERNAKLSPMRLNKMDVLGLLQEHGAVASGHFRLASGLHTPVYLQTALVLQYPHVAHKIAKALAAKFQSGVDVVISTGMSSVVLGQEVARAFILPGGEK